MTDDYADFRDSEVNSNLLMTMRQLADRLEAQEAVVADLEAQLEREKAILKGIKETEIPSALEGLFGKFDLKDGRALEVGQKIRASIAGEKAPPAIKWLDDNGYGAIVKREVVFRFGKDDAMFAPFREFVQNFEKEKGKRLVREDKFSVHPQTLEAFIREKMKEGVDLPRGVLGIYEQHIAKVSGEKAGDIPF